MVHWLLFAALMVVAKLSIGQVRTYRFSFFCCQLESRALAAEMQEWIDPNKQLVIPLERLQAWVKMM